MELLKHGLKYTVHLKSTISVDFFSDKIFHSYTTLTIIVLAALAGLKQFYFSPITCWIPAELKRYRHFIDNYCWVRGTYYAVQSYDERVFSFEPTKENMIYYYQWVPLFLLAQAALLYAPYALWNFLVYRLVDHADFYSILVAARHLEDPSRAASSHLIRKYICSDLSGARLSVAALIPDFMRRVKRAARLPEPERDFKSLDFFSSFTNLTYMKYRVSTSYMCMSYVFIKFLYFVVTLTQIYITDYFLSRNGSIFYGKALWDKFLSGQSELLSTNLTSTSWNYFPLVTVCDVKIKEIETSQTVFHLYNFSCLLPINLFNEKIFMFLWLLYMFVLLPLATYELFVWTKKLIFQQGYDKYMYLKRRLASSALRTALHRRMSMVNRPGVSGSRGDTFLLHIFSEYFVHSDDVLLMRLIEENAGLVVATDLLNEIWSQFQESLDN